MQVSKPKSSKIAFQEPWISSALADSLRECRTLRIVRPGHGICVHGDMAGDYGAAYPGDRPRPDLSLVGTCAVAIASGRIVEAYEDIRIGSDGYRLADVMLIKVALPTWREDLRFARRAAGEGALVALFGAAVHHIPRDCWEHRIEGDAASALIDLWQPSSGVRIGNAYRLFDIDRYVTADGRRRMHLYASRGCNRVCSYCPYIRTLGRWIGRSVDELEEDFVAVQQMGAEIVQFRDQDFASTRDHAEMVCDVLERVGSSALTWIAEGNLDRLDDRLIQRMAGAGCGEIIVGIESASEAVLRRAHRSTAALSDIAGRIANVRRNGIRVRGLFVLGLPGDSWETIAETAEMSTSIGLDAAQFNVYAPLPGDVLEGGRAVGIDDFVPGTNTYRLDVPGTIPMSEVQLAAKYCRRYFGLRQARRHRTADMVARRFRRFAVSPNQYQ